VTISVALEMRKMSKFAYNVNLKKILTGKSKRSRTWNDNESINLEKKGAEYRQA